MNSVQAKGLFAAFESMVKGSQNQEGDIVLRGRKIERVDYGNWLQRLLLTNAKATASDATQNQGARKLFKTALLSYIKEIGLDEKAQKELTGLINTVLKEEHESKPLARRTVAQLVSIVNDTRRRAIHANAGVPGEDLDLDRDLDTNNQELSADKYANILNRALTGKWVRGVAWKLVGGRLGVRITRAQLSRMFSDAIKVAKTKVEGLSNAGLKNLAKGLEAQMKHYLSLFDKNEVGGALERFVINGLDKESVAEEMLRQLEKDAIPEQLGENDTRDGTSSLVAGKGYVSDGMMAKLIKLKEDENKFGSKEVLDRINICPDTDRAVEKMYKSLEAIDLSSEQIKAYQANVKTQNAQAEIANAVPPVDYDVLKILAAKPEMLDELTKAVRDQNPNAPENAGIGYELKRRLLVVMPAFANDSIKLNNFLGKLKDQFVEQRKRNLLGDLLLNARMADLVYYKNDGERILARLAEDAELFNSMRKAAKGFDDNMGGMELLNALEGISPDLKNVFVRLLNAVNARVSPNYRAQQDDGIGTLEFKGLLFTNLGKIYEDFQGFGIEDGITRALSDVAKTVADNVVAQIANVCDNPSGTDLAIIKALIAKADSLDLRRMFATSFREGTSRLGGGVDLAGFIRGMGVYANKILQGLPLKAENMLNLNDPVVKSMYEAVSMSRNDLPKIDPSLLEAELYSSIISNQDSTVASVTVDRWLGTGSVAQTGLCKVIYKNPQDGQAQNVECIDVVIKTLRPDIKATFEREARIVQGLFAEGDTTLGVDAHGKAAREALKSNHYKRVESFNGECDTKKELINALRGIKMFGLPGTDRAKLQEVQGVADSLKTTIQLNCVINGRGVERTEQNLVGSEGLALKIPNAATMGALLTALSHLPEKASDNEYEQLINDYSLGATGEFFMIARAPGEDLARFNKRFANEVVSNLETNNDIGKIKEERKTILTLNRALTQLKTVFLNQALYSKGHFFHCDLTAGNILFDKDTGSLTIIDYGKASQLTDAEALALAKLENIELHKADGLKNGEKMREAYVKLLEAEHAKLSDSYGQLGDGNLTPEQLLGRQQLAIIREAYQKFSQMSPVELVVMDEIFQESFERLAAQEENKDKTVLELFSLILRDVAGRIEGLSLPLPTVVGDFIDTYSRLQNGINDAQNNLNKLNDRITAIIKRDFSEDRNTAINTLSRLNIESLGWLDPSVTKDDDGKVTKVELHEGTYDSDVEGLYLGENSFSARLAKLAGRLDGVEKELTLEERQRTLNAIKVLIVNEKTRLEKVSGLLRNGNGPDYDEMCKSICGGLGIEEEVEFSCVAPDDDGSLNAAIAALAKAEERITSEIDAVSKAFTNDSIYSTSLIADDFEKENEMLAKGHFDLSDVSIQQTPITLADLTTFRACKQQMGVNEGNAGKMQLPESLRTRFRELVVTSGAYSASKDRAKILEYLASDEACTFAAYEKLLGICTSQMGNLLDPSSFDHDDDPDGQEALKKRDEIKDAVIQVPEDEEKLTKLLQLEKNDDGKLSVGSVLNKLDDLSDGVLPTVYELDYTELDLFQRDIARSTDLLRMQKKVFNCENVRSFNLTYVSSEDSKDANFHGKLSRALCEHYSDEFKATTLNRYGFIEDTITNAETIETELGNNASEYDVLVINGDISQKTLWHAAGFRLNNCPCEQNVKPLYDQFKKSFCSFKTRVDEISDVALKTTCNNFIKEIEGLLTTVEPRRGRPCELPLSDIFNDSVTLLDYYRLQRLMSKINPPDEEKLVGHNLDTYKQLQEFAKSLPRGTVKEGNGAPTRRDFSVLVKNIQAGIAKKYTPIGPDEVKTYENFRKVALKVKDDKNIVKTEYQLKQDLFGYVKNMPKKGLNAGYDYSKVPVKDADNEAFGKLVEKAQLLGIPKYQNYVKPNVVTNGDYINVANAVEKALKQVPRLNDNESLVNNVFNINAQFKFGQNEQPYTKFDQDDIFYKKFDKIDSSDLQDVRLGDEKNVGFYILENGIKGNKVKAYAEKKQQIAKTNDLYLRRYRFRQNVADGQGNKALGDIKTFCLNDDLKEADILGAQIQEALVQLFALNPDGSGYQLKGPYYGALRDKLMKTGKFGGMIKEANKTLEDLYTNLKGQRQQQANLQVLLDKLPSQNSKDAKGIKESIQVCAAMIKGLNEQVKRLQISKVLQTSIEGMLKERRGVSMMLDELRNGVKVGDEIKKGEVRDLAFLPLMQELILKLGVHKQIHDLPKAGEPVVNQQPVDNQPQVVNQPQNGDE